MSEEENLDIDLDQDETATGEGFSEVSPAVEEPGSERTAIEDSRYLNNSSGLRKATQREDILVAVDEKIYRDGPAKLRELFESKAGEEAKWLLSFWRDGQIFDILISSPIHKVSLGLLLNKKHTGL